MWVLGGARPKRYGRTSPNVYWLAPFLLARTEMKFDNEPPADAAVAQGLSALKREGGSVLVVGPVRASHDDVCGRFLCADDEADPADPPRMFVCTEGELGCDDADAAAVVERPVRTRSASSTPASSSTRLDPLRREVTETMARVTDDEATLRVCFDSLRPFVDSTPEPELVSFLESLRTTAREVGAVVHVHVPATAEAVPNALYDPVDAVVEVSRRGESTYQQWYLPEADETSEWVVV